MDKKAVNRYIIDLYMRANETEESPLRAIIDDENVIPIFDLIKLKFGPDITFVKYEYIRQNVIIIVRYDNHDVHFQIPGYFVTNMDFIGLVKAEVETLRLIQERETMNEANKRKE